MAEPKATAAAQDPYVDLAAQADEERLSRDARHSAYKQLDPPADIDPPPGPMVEQTLGLPKEVS
jgi:hypothetical protein